MPIDTSLEPSLQLARDIPSEELDEWFEQLKTKLNDIQISIEKQRGMV